MKKAYASLHFQFQQTLKTSEKELYARCSYPFANIENTKKEKKGLGKSVHRSSSLCFIVCVCHFPSLGRSMTVSIDEHTRRPRKQSCLSWLGASRQNSEL
jgi:hypothetical protein